MLKDKIRISFDVPVEEHILYKTECVQSRIPIKEFIHNLVVIGMNQYSKEKLHKELEEGIQQAKEGKGRVISSAELDEWLKDAE